MDAVWAHKWIAAKSLHYQRISYVLGIDFSILKTFFNDDEVRMISILLCNTTLPLRLDNKLSDAFTANVGVPQGDSLSPILFTIYLEFF